MVGANENHQSPRQVDDWTYELEDGYKWNVRRIRCYVSPPIQEARIQADDERHVDQPRRSTCNYVI